MFRTAILTAVVAAGAVVATGRGADPAADGVRGVNGLEHELTEPKTFNYQSQYSSGSMRGYVATFPVKLKAGQPVKVTAHVTGTGRSVGIELLDPTGARTAMSKYGVTTSVLEHPEVHATGTYTIVVASELIGKMNVRAEAPSDAEADKQALEKRIADAERELAALRAKLKALDPKP